MSDKQKRQFILFKKHCYYMGYNPRTIRLSFARLNPKLPLFNAEYLAALFKSNIIHVTSLPAALHLLCENRYIAPEKLRAVL